MRLRIYYDQNALWVDTIDAPFVAGTLAAAMDPDGVTVHVTRSDGTYNFVSPPWTDIADINGSTFAAPDDVMAYLTAQFLMRRPVGSPQRAYAVSAADGQTVFPIDPAPVDVNTLTLVVNGVSYAPPDIVVTNISAVWRGSFPIAASDDVRVAYF